MFNYTESDEIAESMPTCRTYAEAYAIIEAREPKWRENWSIQQRDNIAESMINNAKGE